MSVQLRQYRLRIIETAVATLAALPAVVVAALLGAFDVSSVLTLGVAFVAWIAAAHAGVFKVAISMEDWQTLPTIAVATLVGVVGVSAAEALITQSVHPFASYAVAFIATSVSLIVGSLVGRVVIRAIWNAGYLRTTALVVGNEYTTHEPTLEIDEHRSLGIDVIGSVELSDDSWSMSQGVATAVIESAPDRVILAAASAARDFEIASRVQAADARVYVFPELMSTRSGQAWFAPCQLNGFPLLRVDRKSRQAFGSLVAHGTSQARQF